MKKVFIILFAFSSFLAAAFVPALEREITLTLNNVQISNALVKIQEQTGLIFSYQPTIINNAAPITVQVRKKTVREALAMILPKNITYKSKDNYIILKEKPKEKSGKTEISGYVYDKTTEEKVPNVTIYDKNTLQSVTTDEYGYYSIELASETPSLVVNKEFYADTVIYLNDSASSGIMNITISPKEKIKAMFDSLNLKTKISEVNKYGKKVLQKFKGYVNTVNIKDTITRKFQVSVFPFVGTNHRLSGNVYNKLSFNIYGGYARGLDGFEVGGLFNIEKENVRGFQAAGLFNVVGDSVKGSQIAGLINISGKAAQGFQAAGLMNINDGTQKGFQAAGLMNLSGKTNGTSISGLMNISEKSEGVQIAGLANIQDTIGGTNLSGLYNLADVGEGGSQISGLFNGVDKGEVKFQAAGLFNTASYLSGAQIAPFNYADTASGVPIGLLSFVKKGLHQMEISADELFYPNLSFRTGVSKFYNILSIGIQPSANRNLWQLGYGVGTSFPIKNKWHGDITVAAHHLSIGPFNFGASDLYKGYIGVEYKFGKKFSIAGGPTINLFVTDRLLPDYENTFGDIAPNSFMNKTNSLDYNTRAWVGGRIAFRFF